MDKSNIPGDWLAAIGEEFNKEYFLKLENELDEEYINERVYPEDKDIFNALRWTPLSKVKVVILGQDPYPKEGQAIGVSFSVKEGQKPPRSLQNIYTELEKDDRVDFSRPTHGYLKKWADEGVLLLNAVLTVRANQRGSHRGKDWETFTDAVLKAVNMEDRPIVYLLWGNDAQKKEHLMTNPKHKVLKARHPSPFWAKRGFFDCHHFSKTNDFLEKERDDSKGIDWKIDDIH